MKKWFSRGAWLLILGILLVAIDQVIKAWVKASMVPGEQIFVIGQWFRLCFVENEGFAFGMKFGGVWGKYALSLFRIGLFSVLTVWIARLCRRPEIPAGVLAGLTLIDAGALGNIIDCLFYGLIYTPHYPFLQGRVVDMFYFPIIRTEHFVFFEPVFNFADACVTVGAIYLLLFQWRFFVAEEKKEG
ncbi:MAG: signal peptidase II [Bacteroidales bacterium]|nr:signal peptidase II [Bacteroidales bacterium]